MKKITSMMAIMAILASSLTHATVIQIEPATTKINDLAGTVEDAFGKIKLNIQEKIIKVPVHKEAYIVYAARVDKATQNFQNALKDIKRKLENKLGEAHSQVNAAEDLYKQFPTEANKKILAYTQSELAKVIAQLKNEVTLDYTKAWGRLSSLDGFLIFPVDVKAIPHLSGFEASALTVGLSTLAVGGTAAVIAYNSSNHNVNTTVAVGLASGALATFAGALAATFIYKDLPQNHYDDYEVTYSNAEEAKLEASIDYSWSGDAIYRNIPTQHDVNRIKTNAAENIFASCGTIACTYTMAEEYKNWLKEVQANTNKGLAIVDGISLPVIPVASESTISAAMDDLVKTIIPAKSSIF